MRWKSWLPRSSPRLRVVAGLDVSSQGCQLVILSGAQAEASCVCCAEYLDVPKGWIRHGQMVQTDLFGCWLREHLAQGGYDIDALRMGIDDACVSSHEFTLAPGLSDEDVAFQLSVEMQAWMSDADVCVDFRPIHLFDDSQDTSFGELPTYQVRAVPRSQVALMLEMAKSARLDLVAVEGRRDARERIQSREVLQPFPTVSVGLALQCEVAFGLALGAWQPGAFNFLPHRERAQDVRRRAWYLGMMVWAVGGVFMTAGLTWALSTMADHKQSRLADFEAVSRSLDAASQAHSEAQTIFQVATEQHRWLQTRQALHQNTLQWAHVLNHSMQGLWVSGVTQQGVQWGVQGEALTSAHAHDLIAQLNKLEIWARAPEMRQLQLLRSAANSGLPVWQFRIEAELKGGQR